VLVDMVVGLRVGFLPFIYILKCESI
jgi:hypothetical protein